MKKKLIYISCFILLHFTNCEKNTSTDKITPTTVDIAHYENTDYSPLIDKIQQEFNTVEAIPQQQWSKVLQVKLWNSIEGGKIQYFYDANQILQKIMVIGYEDIGEYVEVFIFDNTEKLIFNLRKNYTYSADFNPLQYESSKTEIAQKYIKDSVIYTSYFDKNVLIQQSISDGTITPIEMLQNRGNNILESLDEYLAVVQHKDKEY